MPGASRRSRNSSSVRSSPQSSAPAATATRTSSRPPRLANTSMRVPSAMRQSSAAAMVAAWRWRACSASLLRVASSTAGAGSMCSLPASASRASAVSSAMPSSAGPSATSAGMFIAAAINATCEVGPPPAVAMPASRAGSRLISCDGNRSCASRMVRSGRAVRATADGSEGLFTSPPVAPAPSASAAVTCYSRSSRSSARAAIRGSATARRLAIDGASAAVHAAAALLPRVSSATAASLTSGSSSNVR